MNKSYKDGEMTVSTNIGIRQGESKVSMISELVKGLRELGNQMKRNDVAAYNLIFDAAYTIEALSEKVRANNLHEGWIPCSERLPKAGRFRHYIITLRKDYETINRVYEAWYTESGWRLGLQMLADKDVLAWMPLPEPYEAS